ncbi:SpaA isopeptide-forming pilin-related protein [Carboxylicivirga sp. RSCT41]|uniref:SpaA isopeptide-forming pilin-related protein n=1 Tax=Carboxylicivirga agarovorans TaxID=3417570 RepID=UPI003D34875E
MKKLLLLMAMTAIVFSSCEKEQDEYTLIHKFSGELSVKLENANGEPIKGVKLKLKDDGEELDEQETDANGSVKFGSVNSGNYTIYGEDIKDGEYAYNVYKQVQIVAAEHKETTIVPSEYNASINLKAFEYYQYESSSIPLGSDVKIALLHLPDQHMYQFGYDNLSLEELKEYILTEIQADGITEEFVFENIPLHNYLLMFYTNDNYYISGTNINAYNKNKTVYLKYHIESIKIREYRVDQVFFVQQRTYDNSSYYYHYEAYQDCEIYIINYADYRNMHYNQLQDKSLIENIAVDKGITNSEGMVTINTIRHRDLMACCYNPDGVLVGNYSFSIGYYLYNSTINFTYYNYN